MKPDGERPFVTHSAFLKAKGSARTKWSFLHHFAPTSRTEHEYDLCSSACLLMQFLVARGCFVG